MADRNRRTIRFRLTVWYAAILALALLLLILAATQTLERRLTSNFDDDLHTTARAIQQTAEVRTFGDGLPVSIDMPALDPFSVAGYFIQISRPDGRIEYRSDGLGPRDLPLTDLSDGLERVRFDTITLEGERFRIIYSPIRITTNPELLGVISVASSIDQIEHSIEQMRRVLGFGGALAMIASILAGWFLSGRALKPVEQMRRDVDAIAFDNSDRLTLADRVRDPGTGDELSRLAQTFNELLDRLEAAFENERRFLADASHELRTPLTAIRGNVDVLIRQAAALPHASADLSDALGDIQRESSRMSRLVEDLLILARTSAGGSEKQFASVEVSEPIERAIRTATALAPDRAIKLQIEHPVTVNASADQIEQLVLILLDNALRHSQAPSPIDVSLSQINDQAVMTVTDQGEGIAPEHLPHLFERFYRVDTNRSRSAGGSGLGLAIARAIAERCDGEIRVESVLGSGTTFTVTLPITTPGAPVR
jgi:signal transduction histidine kinase